MALREKGTGENRASGCPQIVSLDHYHRGIELLIHLMYRLAEAG